MTGFGIRRLEPAVRAAKRSVNVLVRLSVCYGLNNNVLSKVMRHLQ
jgi:hypothetical protein